MNKKINSIENKLREQQIVELIRIALIDNGYVFQEEALIKADKIDESAKIYARPDFSFFRPNNGQAVILEIKDISNSLDLSAAYANIIFYLKMLKADEFYLITNKPILAEILNEHNILHQEISDFADSIDVKFEILTAYQFLKKEIPQSSILNRLNDLNLLELFNNFQLYNSSEWEKNLGGDKKDLERWLLFLGEHIDLKRVETNNIHFYKPEKIIGNTHSKIIVLSADMVSFSSFVEASKTKNLLQARMLEYFNESSRIVRSKNGWIDSFAGDGILAYWGFDENIQDESINVSKCAFELITFSNRLANEWLNDIDIPIEKIGLRVGISIGEITLLKSAAFSFNYTAIGSCINIASRLQSDANPNEVLVTNQFRNVNKKLENSYSFLNRKTRKLKNVGDIISWNMQKIL